MNHLSSKEEASEKSDDSQASLGYLGGTPEVEAELHEARKEVAVMKATTDLKTQVARLKVEAKNLKSAKENLEAQIEEYKESPDSDLSDELLFLLGSLLTAEGIAIVLTLHAINDVLALILAVIGVLIMVLTYNRMKKP